MRSAYCFKRKLHTYNHISNVVTMFLFFPLHFAMFINVQQLNKPLTDICVDLIKGELLHSELRLLSFTTTTM